MESESAPEEEVEAQPVAGNQGLARLKQFIQGMPRIMRLIQVLSRLNRPITVSRLAIIEALIGILQRMKDRLSSSAETDEKDDKRKGHAEVEAATVEEAPKKAPARIVFVFVLALLIGGFAGMVFSFTLFAKMIVNQAERIDAQRDNISILEKENARAQEAEANYRNDLTETQKKLDETERNLNLSIAAARNKFNARRSGPSVSMDRTEAKGTAFPEYLGNSSALPGAMAKQQGAAQKSRTCEVEVGNTDKDMARCLDELKRK